MTEHQAHYAVNTKKRRSPIIAGVAGFLLPGCGQIYCRQDNKGVFLLAFSLLGHWLTAGLSSLLICPAMGLDAFLAAKQINRGKIIGRWEFFPGLHPLNHIPARTILLSIVFLIATITVIRIVRFASDTGF